MLLLVAYVRSDVSEERIISIIRVVGIGELESTLGVTSAIEVCSLFRLPVNANVVSSSPILVTLMMEVIRSSETSVLTGATRLNIPGGRHS
jgi:hypothetical protein